MSFGFDVESVAHRGDTVEDMAYSDGQLDDFSRRVEKVIRTGVEPVRSFFGRWQRRGGR